MQSERDGFFRVDLPKKSRLSKPLVSRIQSIRPLKLVYHRLGDLNMRFSDKHVDLPLYTFMQILSVTSFEKLPLNQLLTETDDHESMTDGCNQLVLFNL